MADSRSSCRSGDTLTALADDGMECVFHARSQAEAERHRTVLESYGILTRVGGESENGLAIGALAGLPLFVPTVELERASEILARCDIEGAEWDEEDDFEDDEEEEEDEEDEDEEDDDYFPEDDEDEDEEEEADDDL